QSEIHSIQQAIVRLGQAELRKFTALIATATLAEGKPDELIKLSFVRARFMEQLALHNKNYGADAASAFLTGLLSKLDAMMDNDLNAILSGVAIAAEIKRPLIEGKGPLSFFLKACEALETTDWAKLELIAERLRVESKTLVLYYQQAQAWAREIGRQ
ncbi:MAG: HDOD domain-containing protein, partial [Pseudomonadota bacterium]|nr:HDOD domain-containing protein [Pseudomonadota bacterium]